MGVECRCYLIPRNNPFRPSAEKVLALVAALQENGWLLSSERLCSVNLPFDTNRRYGVARKRGYFALTVGAGAAFDMALPELLPAYADRDLMVVWPVESLGKSGLRYPLEPVPADDTGESDESECYYEIQLHFGQDFIYHSSEVVETLDEPPECSCENTLEYELELAEDPFLSPRISMRCPECGTSFDPSKLVAVGRDGFTGEEFRIRGGAVYRFAIVVDCGKCVGWKSPRFHPEFKSVVERTLGIETYEIVSGS